MCFLCVSGCVLLLSFLRLGFPHSITLFHLSSNDQHVNVWLAGMVQLASFGEYHNYTIMGAKSILIHGHLFKRSFFLQTI